MPPKRKGIEQIPRLEMFFGICWGKEISELAISMTKRNENKTIALKLNLFVYSVVHKYIGLDQLNWKKQQL